MIANAVVTFQVNGPHFPEDLKLLIFFLHRVTFNQSYIAQSPLLHTAQENPSLLQPVTI
jgi:hypothetical protein